uniref:MULE transposase domain-containing protein n=1 Tax=Panagrolaimus davidi TaxID=227884 RepID=A0A914PTG1_9BILA
MIVLYYTDKFIEPDELFCDGTFLYAPQLPEVPQRNIQLYRIFGLIHETVIVPCFTIIMQKKTEDEYKIVFEAIADIVGRWRLAARIAHFDGETAAVNAFKSIRKFRRIKCKMCSFHVRQCLHRHGATLGLTRDYGEEKNQFIKHFTTSIGGLQHAPTGILDEAVTALNDFLNGQHAIDQAVIEKLQYLLNEYFVPTWLEHSLGIEFVSAADVTTNCTNNYAETFHGNQKLFYKQPHAKLGQFLFDDRRLQNCLETEIKLMESGDHDIPEKNDDGDRKRASTRARMMNQLAVANVNRGEIILKYVHRLGKYAGMAGEF